jgi:nitroalkane oxidase
MIDFTLTPEQQSLRDSVRQFADTHLASARKEYEQVPQRCVAMEASATTGKTRFQSTKPILSTATSMGLVKSLVPRALGGTAGTLVDSMIITEELFAVEPSVSLTLLAIGLGLTPVFLGDFTGREDLRSEILAPFTHQGDDTTAPLASLCFSEPSGSANFLDEEGDGLQTTASYDADSDSWIVNGDKIWGTNCSGWDELGADLQVLFVRNPAITSSKADSSMLLLLTRATLDQNRSNINNAQCYTVVRHPITPGLTSTSSPHIHLSHLSIPSRYVLSTGHQATHIINTTFTTSATTVAAMSIGIMRAAFTSALSFARTHSAGGTLPILHHQSPADLLIAIKCRLEASRALAWKAAAALDHGLPGAPELAFEVKIFASEAAVTSLAEAMRVVGVSAYDAGQGPLAGLMADALVLPLFDGGNQGVRRRQVQNLFLDEAYRPWDVTFGRERVVVAEGAGGGGVGNGME